MCHEATLLDGTGTHKWSFNTYRFSTGAPYTLAGTPSLDCRVNGSATQATSGLALTADFDSRTGENQASIDVDDATLALTDGDWVEVFIAAGTVDSVSAVGTVVGRFYISNGSLSTQTKADIEAECEDALDTKLGSLSTDLVTDLTDGTIADIGQIDVSELNAIVDDLLNGGRLDLLIDAIKAKTDNLPTDPADESQIQAAIAALENLSAADIQTVLDANGITVAAGVGRIAGNNLANGGTGGQEVGEA